MSSNSPWALEVRRGQSHKQKGSAVGPRCHSTDWRRQPSPGAEARGRGTSSPHLGPTQTHVREGVTNALLRESTHRSPAMRRNSRQARTKRILAATATDSVRPAGLRKERSARTWWYGGRRGQTEAATIDETRRPSASLPSAMVSTAVRDLARSSAGEHRGGPKSGTGRAPTRRRRARGFHGRPAG